MFLIFYKTFTISKSLDLELATLFRYGINKIVCQKSRTSRHACEQTLIIYYKYFIDLIELILGISTAFAVEIV